MNKVRVLVAEDQLILRQNLQKMLELTNQIEVVAAVDSGKLAFEEAKRLQPEIILMDIEMESGNSGIIAAQNIINFNDRIKIIFLTVHEDDKTIIEAINNGGTDYVIKTRDCKVVIEHVLRAHEDKVVLDAAIQNIFHEEYLKLSKSKNENLKFLRKVILLTPSERAIIYYLLKNIKPIEIANIRYVEVVTIKKQIGTLLKKLDEKRSKAVVKKIIEIGIESLFQDDMK